MPPLPPYVGAARIYVKGSSTAGGPAFGTRFFVRKSDVTALTTVDMADLATAWGATGTTNPISALLASQTTSWNWTSATITDLGVSGMQTMVSFTQTGTVSSASHPPQVSVCLSWHAPLVHWRGGKPRNYIPGIPQSATLVTSLAQIQPSYAAALATAAVNLQTKAEAVPASSGTWQLGFISYFSGHALRPTPSFFHYNSVNVHQRLDSQRRRSGKESAFAFS